MAPEFRTEETPPYGEVEQLSPLVRRVVANNPSRFTYHGSGTFIIGPATGGDVAIIDEDGFVSIVDRIKDLIIVSGFNVYPNEIEDVVAAHPKVANAAAIGIPDEKSGEAVKLFVVPNDKSLTIDELKEYCRANFTGYKVPKQYEIRESLPMSAVGKILRRELRDE